MRKLLKTLAEISMIGMGFPSGVIVAAVIGMSLYPEVVSWCSVLIFLMLVCMLPVYFLGKRQREREEESSLGFRNHRW